MKACISNIMLSVNISIKCLILWNKGILKRNIMYDDLLQDIVNNKYEKKLK